MTICSKHFWEGISLIPPWLRLCLCRIAVVGEMAFARKFSALQTVTYGVLITERKTLKQKRVCLTITKRKDFQLWIWLKKPISRLH